MKTHDGLLATFAVLFTLCVPLPAYAQTSGGTGFSLHRMNVTGFYPDRDGYVRLNTNAFLYDTETMHLQQGEFGLSAPFVRFNSIGMNGARITSGRAVANYDGWYWPKTPSQGEGIPAMLTFTTDTKKRFVVLIMAKTKKTVLYRYAGTFQSASIVLE